MSLTDENVAFLRGLSVIFVFIFHLYPSYFSYGYLGVDIFLVLSGYLVSKSFDNKYSVDYQFSDVLRYLKIRIRRVFPLLLVILQLSIILNIFLLNLNNWTNEYSAVVLGYYNWYINGVIDYNNELMTASPLLHLWSVSVELQLYSLFIIYLITIKILRISYYAKWAALLLVIYSVGSIYISSVSSDLSSYYSTTWRAAQFILGVLLYLNGHWVFNLMSGIIISQTYIIGLDDILPNLLVPVLFINCTSILFRMNQNLNRSFNSRVSFVTSLGYKAYSYYLVHFVFIYFYNLVGERGIITDIILTIIICVVGNFSYRSLETSLKKCLLVNITIAAPLFAYLVLYSFENTLNRDKFEKLLDPAGMESCRADFDKGVIPPCTTYGDGEEVILVVGDSHAFQLTGGFGRNDYKSLTTLSYAGCPPLQSFSRSDRRYIDCDKASEYWKDWIEDKKYDKLIITARWPYYFRSEIGLIGGVGIDQKHEDVRLWNWLDEMGAPDKVLVAPTPEFPTSSYVIYLRNIIRSKFGLAPIMQLKINSSEASAGFFSHAKSDGYRVLNLDEALCIKNECTLINNDGDFLYRDSNHLSSKGAEIVVRKILDN